MSDPDNEDPAIQVLPRTPENLPPQPGQAGASSSFDIGLGDSLGGDLNYGSAPAPAPSPAPGFPAPPPAAEPAPKSRPRVERAEVSDWNAAMTTGEHQSFSGDLPTTNIHASSVDADAGGGGSKLLYLALVVVALGVLAVVAKKVVKGEKKPGGVLAAPVERPKNAPACWKTDEGYEFEWNEVRVSKITDVPEAFRSEAKCKLIY